MINSDNQIGKEANSKHLDSKPKELSELGFFATEAFEVWAMDEEKEGRRRAETNGQQTFRGIFY